MPPIVGNATFSYARLNVADGLRTVFDRPWTDRERSRPALTEVGDSVDVRRAWYHEDERLLQLTVSPMHGVTGTGAELALSRVWGRGPWTLTVDGAVVAEGDDTSVVSTDGTSQLGRVDDELRLALDVHGHRDIEMSWREV